MTIEEIRLILGALAKVYGTGYSDRPEVCKLQTKLSIMLAVAVRRVEVQQLKGEKENV